MTHYLAMTHSSHAGLPLLERQLQLLQQLQQLHIENNESPLSPTTVTDDEHLEVAVDLEVVVDQS